VIQTFCELIKVLNVDIITGWFSHGYDLPYILKRCEKLFGSMNLISPLENVWMGNRKFGDEYKIRISGLDTVDMMQGVGKFNYKLQNNKLDTAAEMILG
jgi:DNA polymerase elongation subunit (family B)